MRNRMLCIMLATFTLSFPSAGFGWIDTGHKIVAMISWPDLTDKTKQAVSALLKEHPQYGNHLLLNMPADFDEAAKARYAYATAATWPDLVRMRGNPMSTLYNHPSWHYIDLPVFEGYADPATRPSPQEPRAVDGEPANAVEALIWAEKQLKDQSLRASDRAIALCWMEHLIGDIHQPLHDASLFSPEFPNGDKGGNSEWVTTDPPYPDSAENLHLYWDSVPGNYKSQLMDGYMAAGIRDDPQFSREALKPLLSITDYMEWAKEGHQLAETVAYEDGHLDSARVVRGRRPGHDVTIPGLSVNYEIEAEHTAAHQVALAGYRLADTLNRIFDAKRK